MNTKMPMAASSLALGLADIVASFAPLEWLRAPVSLAAPLWLVFGHGTACKVATHE